MTAVSISVIGMGYVGCVSAAYFASIGHRVVGVDSNAEKLALLRQGRSPVQEKGIGDLVAGAVASGMLRVTHDVVAAVHASDVSLVCVGTPSGPAGGLDTGQLERVAREIGAAIATTQRRHVVAFRSTMVPGSCESLLIPLMEAESGLRAGVDFGVCVNPEFLREGSSIADFLDPPKTVVGQSDGRSGACVMALYDGLPGPRFQLPIAAAEMVKYADNSYHALKVAFANEIGAVCAALGVDTTDLMTVFLADTKLNVSAAYLQPGFAFGGSCLPKDLRAVVHAARGLGLDVPLLASVLPSNAAHLRRFIAEVVATGRSRASIFGLSFKSGTDDLRESPMVELATALLAEGLDVRIHDTGVTVAQLVGSNLEYVLAHLPQLDRLLVPTVQDALDHADICILGSCDDAVADVVRAAGNGRLVVDLAEQPTSKRWSVLETHHQPGFVPDRRAGRSRAR